MHSWVESGENLRASGGGDGQDEEDDDGGVFPPPPGIVQLDEGHSEPDGQDDVEGAQDSCTARLNSTWVRKPNSSQACLINA